MKPGDMMIADSRGIISSVIYGPDQRTRITPKTTRVLFTAYVPPGIGKGEVRAHLEDIQANVLVVSPRASTETFEIHTGE